MRLVDAGAAVDRARRQLENFALAHRRRQHRQVAVLEPGDKKVHRLRLELGDLNVEILFERERDRFLEAQLAKRVRAGAGLQAHLGLLEIRQALLIRAHGLLDHGVLAGPVLGGRRLRVRGNNRDEQDECGGDTGETVHDSFFSIVVIEIIRSGSRRPGPCPCVLYRDAHALCDRARAWHSTSGAVRR